jgi:hypothetical protein
METKLMLAPNPRRSGGVDRVIIVGRTDDGSQVSVLSIDELQKDQWAKQQFAKYFVGNASWNLAAIVIVLAGIAASFLLRWWAFVPALLISGWLGYQGKSSGATAAVRILHDHPWARDRFVQSGLIWDAPARDVVES